MPRKSKFFRYDPESDSVVERKRSVVQSRPRYPIECETLAVDPSQIAESMEFDRSQGVPTSYTDDGSPIMEDAAHYRRYRRAHGYHFRNAYDD